MHVKSAAIILSATLLPVPLVAHDAGEGPEPLIEPTVQAEWLNAMAVQREFASETNGFSRFQARPAMKIGLMIEADGTVTECLPLAVEKDGPAYGKELCAAITEHAQFTPARDDAGDAIRSVYIVLIDEYRPGSAAENRIFG